VVSQSGTPYKNGVHSEYPNNIRRSGLKVYMYNGSK
jgi:hypothetical protein